MFCTNDHEGIKIACFLQTRLRTLNYFVFFFHFFLGGGKGEGEVCMKKQRFFLANGKSFLELKALR